MKLVAQAASRIPIVNLPQPHNRDLWTVHLTILHITESIGIRGISDRNTVIKGYVSYRQMDFRPAKDRSRDPNSDSKLKRRVPNIPNLDGCHTLLLSM